MNLQNKIIFIILLIILLSLLYLNNNFNKNSYEKFGDSKNYNDYGYFKKISDIKKNKTTQKSIIQNNFDYSGLEVKILSKNSIYNNLNNYLKKYNTNLIYNLENLDINLPLIVAYDNQSVRNDKNESFVNFLKGLNFYKYNFIICGINTKWDGWYGRYKTYLELLENIPSKQLIFLTDARDVLVNDTPTEFVKNYNKITNLYNDKQKNKIIFGTEVGCCVNQMWHYSPGTVFTNINDEKINNIKNNIVGEVIHKKGKNDDSIKYIDQIEIQENKSEYNSHPSYSLFRDDFHTYPNGKKFPWEHWLNWNKFYKYKFIEANLKYKLNIKDSKYPFIKLNFGMLVGSCFNVLKMLKTLDLRLGEDDQHLASEFYFMRPEMVIMDYTQILLSNTGYKHSFRKCTSKTMNNTHYNLNFNDHLNDHDEYVNTGTYTREDIDEQGIMYGFDIQHVKYFFTYDDIISYPCFIQSPGKDWNCYNELLYKLPYCDDKMCSYYYNLDQTQRYNIKDIIIHEFKNQSGDMKIEWILKNLMNPIYWVLDLFIVKNIFDTIQNDMVKSDTFVLIDSGNLLGYKRFNKLDMQHIMPWDDDFDLGWYTKKKFSKEIIEEFFKQMIKKGYELFIYYKEIYKPYSTLEKEHLSIRLTSKNIQEINNILDNFEIVLFNVAISAIKYNEILKIFNMSPDYEEKYVDGSLKIPSVDIFMYEFNTHTTSFEYNKLFGIGYNVSIKENCIMPIKSAKYNKLDIKIPNNIDCVLNSIYMKNYNDQYNNLDLIVLKRHSNSNELIKKNEQFNSLKLNENDKDIILITKIFNNFINKYYEIISSNENIKKIIMSSTNS